ncbi:hypothetical protein TEA_028829 [Camellia sinensis var. sinensis]|uniref:Malic enzyme NAD-binding domain-containing protein n=1 Tax=Camellia sinensis var. sinensis TaxID=542762 RepID=A0A4S4E4Z4_CAMSN|nr:hypothetical protein TEA_028829 [Camellia sinensis var. sinensis]
MGIWLLLYCNMIVLTDGSRILGLGDLGILPVMLDVGTNNQKLLEDCLSIDFFEDFQMKWAFERLQRYQKRFCMFNDDMQGTAGVALAGLLGSVRAQGRPLTNYVNQKIVVVGAGSAGLDVFNMATKAVSRMAGAEASPQFFLLDKDVWFYSYCLLSNFFVPNVNYRISLYYGLITTERKGADPAAAPFAKAPGEIKGLGLREGANLVEVVKRVKPHVLLGLSEVSGIFNEQVGSPLTECTAVDAFNHAGENIVFASGSPFKNVDLAEVGAVVVRAAVAEELAEGRCDVGPKELR